MGNETKKLQIIDLQGLLMRKMDFVPISLFLHFANAIILKSKKTTQVNLVVFIFKFALVCRERGIHFVHPKRKYLASIETQIHFVCLVFCFQLFTKINFRYF